MRPHADFPTSVKKYQYLLTQSPSALSSHQSLAAAGRWLWCEGGNVIDNLLPLHLELRVFLGLRILEGRQEAQEFVLHATNNWREELFATGNGGEQRTRLRSKMSSTSFVLLGLAAKILNTWNASNAIAWEGSANAFITRRRCRGSAMYRLICRPSAG